MKKDAYLAAIDDKALPIVAGAVSHRASDYLSLTKPRLNFLVY